MHNDHSLHDNSSLVCNCSVMHEQVLMQLAAEEDCTTNRLGADHVLLVTVGGDGRARCDNTGFR